MDRRQSGGSKLPRNHDARLGKRSRPSEPASDRAQYEHSAPPPTAPHDQSQSGVAWQYQASYQEPLTYRHSPNSLSSPSTSSVEQSVLGEQSQGPLSQNSFNLQIFQGNSLSGAYIWPQDEGDDFSHSYVGPIGSHHQAVAPPPTSKRKREPDSFTEVLLPYPHKDWHLVPQSSVASYHSGEEIILCSRCNIYESLFGVPGFCSSCLQVSFNRWPSALGTRNENLESLVLFLMPAHMEDVLRSAPWNMPRSRSWRMLPQTNKLVKYETAEDGFKYRWSFLKRLVMLTRLFPNGFDELADIAQVYQLSVPTKSKALETCCTALISVCELYHTIIGDALSSGPQTISIPKAISNIRSARITVRHAFQQFQKLAASPSPSRDRQDWIPAFLSASILAIAAIVFIDTLVACPSPYKEQIWGEAWNDKIVEMRNGGYGMLISLLRANSGEVNPLKMKCWDRSESGSGGKAESFDPFINATSESYSPEGMSQQQPAKKRSKSSKISPPARTDVERERNVLLGISSPAALQGMLALKEWNRKYSHVLAQGDNMFARSPLQLAKQAPLAALFRIFELR